MAQTWVQSSISVQSSEKKEACWNARCQFRIVNEDEWEYPTKCRAPSASIPNRIQRQTYTDFLKWPLGIKILYRLCNVKEISICYRDKKVNYTPLSKLFTIQNLVERQYKLRLLTTSWNRISNQVEITWLLKIALWHKKYLIQIGKLVCSFGLKSMIFKNILL